MNKVTMFPDEDELSSQVDIPRDNTEGLGKGFALRRHKCESEADEGSREARADWAKLIGPPTVAGCCNPFSGHFNALVLPTCLPERLRIISYIFEYAFLHDVVMESAAQAAESQVDGEHDFLSSGFDPETRAVIGSKQMQSKMVLGLMSIDPACAEVCVEAWKTMVDTTSGRDKNEAFTNMDDYLEYRIVDTGAPFVDKHMCFGMGIVLDEQELHQVGDIAHAAYAALGLANDYFSFDVEYGEFQQNDKKAMTNVVWLFMHWYGVDVAEAKRMAREETRKYERQFLQLREQAEPSFSSKLRRYVQGLAYQIAGNVVWSTDNPRYHPEKDIYREDMTDFDRSLAIYHTEEGEEHDKGTRAPVESQILRSSATNELSVYGHERKSSVDSSSSGSDAWSDQASTSSSRTSISEPTNIKEHTSEQITESSSLLDTNVISAPFKYISSLPSKGARDMFIDALTVWTPTSKEKVDKVKDIIKSFHNVSLMLDDFEDGSELRRGKPSTHVIFGAAQTVNSAGYFVLETLKQLGQLDPRCMNLAIGHVQDLYLGQSFDLYWTRQSACPTEQEYLAMVDKKTGGLFRLAEQLLQTLSRQDNIGFDPLVQLLGRFFQVRDDYNNLVDQTYTDQKGYCEDLDEGKFSFPLVHALRSGKQNMQLHALLQSRRENSGLSKEAKMLVLKELDTSGSMDYTKQRLCDMQKQIEKETGRLERQAGSENWIMRLLLHKLKV
ncbi:hypothetical protein PMZ80_008301 [Knufia obscura]|uniref:Geranylgeranyl diphosphate synthase n=2 Tax=Knufia TaxID=430999 RepID=A0AAN8I635_9EURO|nr:hypothetical protein PMZ80_008296 [Knufia obscura]KAK5938999.1 hypothetical protein PMZ80_008301 [Knufia obscura]KAK5951186.1 hypothetical protein OHC33_007603 [Knufia fluminis]